MSDLTKYFKDGAYRIPDTTSARALVKTEILRLLLKKGRKLYEEGGNLSKAREGLPDVYIDNVKQNLSNVSKYIRNKIENKPFTNPSFNSSVKNKESKGGRKEALTGLSPIGVKQTNFLDESTRLKKILQQNLERTPINQIKKRQTIISNFDKKMSKLFHDNRDWLPTERGRPIKYDPSKVDTYGWQDGSSTQDYLKWQNKVYKESQAQTRGFFAESGVEMHAGHGFSAGGLKITPEQMKEFDIPTRQLIRADGEPDPDTKGGFILKGTNSVSNLAIEVAKKNLSHGKDITRNIQDLLELNVAFTKTGSLQEYLNRNTTNYRKSEDFNRVTRNFLLHSQDDINAVLSKGEDELLQTGIVETPSMLGSGKIKPKPLSQVTSTLGPTKSYTERLGNITNVREYDNLLASESKRIFDEQNKGIKTLQNVAEYGLRESLNLAGTYVGKPDAGTQIFNIVKTVKAVNEGDTVGAIIEGTSLLKQESLERLDPDWNKRSQLKAITRDIYRGL